MKHTRLTFALLLWIAIISPSCDSKTKPAPAEPTPAEPTPAEPTPAEPTPAEPTPAEPTPAEPTPAEPTPAEPTPAEPAPAEPAPAEPAPADQASTDESARPSTEYLKSLQGAMAAAMQANDLETAGQIAEKIQKLAAQINAQQESAQTPAPAEEAVANPEATPAVAQETEPVAEEPAPAATPEAAPTPTSDPALTAQVARFTEQFEKSKTQAVAPIQKRFDFAAQQLLRKATQSGNLDAAMQLKSMIEDSEALGSLTDQASSPQEKELLRLVQLRDKETALAVSRIQKLLLLQAQSLIGKATRAGDLEAAAKVQALIAESSPQPGLMTPSISSSNSTSQSKECPENDFKFTFQGNTVTITKYVGNSEEVRVPSKIQGAMVTKIGVGAFRGCAKIKEIVLPDTIQVIDHMAFAGANNLIQFNIPNSVISFSGHFHFSSPKLKKLLIPASVKNIGTITTGCKSLEKIEIDPANEFYTSIDGVLYNKEITKLINIPAGIKNRTLKIPSTVDEIGALVVCGSELKEIQIPKDANVDEAAFNKFKTGRVVRY